MVSYTSSPTEAFTPLRLIKHQKLARFVLAFLMGGLVLSACKEEARPAQMREIPFEPKGVLEFVNPNGAVIRQIAIEVADTDSSRMRGLMDRRSLSTRQGMLFIFPDETDRSFWMQNTPLPLDIIFVAADSQIVNIAKHTTPLSPEQVTSTGPAKYVVEVRAGFTDRYAITDSARVRWVLVNQ